jgi:hypothetical protein
MSHASDVVHFLLIFNLISPLQAKVYIYIQILEIYAMKGNILDTILDYVRYR